MSESDELCLILQERSVPISQAFTEELEQAIQNPGLPAEIKDAIRKELNTRNESSRS